MWEVAVQSKRIPSVVPVIEAISAWPISQQVLSAISIFPISRFPDDSMAIWAEPPGLVHSLSSFFFGHLGLQCPFSPQV